MPFTRREFGHALTTAALSSTSLHAGRGLTTAPYQSQSAGSLTDVPGIKVGHYTDARRPTGCTAILFDRA